MHHQGHDQNCIMRTTFFECSTAFGIARAQQDGIIESPSIDAFDRCWKKNRFQWTKMSESRVFENAKIASTQRLLRHNFESGSNVISFPLCSLSSSRTSSWRRVQSGRFSGHMSHAFSSIDCHLTANHRTSQHIAILDKLSKLNDWTALEIWQSTSVKFEQIHGGLIQLMSL
jgi:hypothetical protein